MAPKARDAHVRMYACMHVCMYVCSCMHVLLSTSIPFYVAVYLLLARSSSMAEGIAAVIGNVADNCGPAAP